MVFPFSILGGQILFGIGSTTIETAQSKLYTQWYEIVPSQPNP
jgi:hypothetical protein